jgi:hypothetical protein
MLLAIYPEVVLGVDSFFYRNFGIFSEPVAHYARQSLWRGEIPLWNPLNNCGVPFLAQWDTTICYPLAWFYILLPLPWSLNYFCLGHLLLAGLGMYWLAFEWTCDRLAASVAGLTFALNGLIFNCLMWTSNLAALSWLPLVVLLVERARRRGGRAIVHAALAGCMQMLSGAPEIVLMTWIALATLCLGQVLRFRRPSQPHQGSLLACRFVLVLFLVLGLSAVQLLPFLELLEHSHRGADAFNGSWSMPLWGWANFLVPLFRCTKLMLGNYVQVEQQWTSSYYLGIGVLALATVAFVKARSPKVWWLGALALVGLIASLGDNAFLYSWIKGIFRPFGSAPHPIKFIVLTVFSVPLLAAFGVRWLNRQRTAHGSSIGGELFWSGCALLVGIAGVLVASRCLPYADESRLITLWNGADRALFLLLILGTIFLYGKTTSGARRGVLAFGVLLLLGLDEVTHTPQNPTVGHQAFGILPPPMSSLPVVGQGRAMLSPRMQALLGNASTTDPLQYYTGIRRSLYGNCNLLDDIPKVNGFYSLTLRQTTEVNSLLYNPINLPQGLLDFLGVVQLSSADVMFKWKSRPTGLPWITAGQQPIFAPAVQTLRAIGSSQFDPRRVVYLPPEARNSLHVTDSSTAEIRAPEVTAHRIAFDVNASQRALVVIAQATYPCWQAFVDGGTSKIWPANHAFQAIEVPAGRHRVLLVYRDKAFYLGAGVSLACLVACLALYRMTGRQLPSHPAGN